MKRNDQLIFYDILMTSGCVTGLKLWPTDFSAKELVLETLQVSACADSSWNGFLRFCWRNKILTFPTRKSSATFCDDVPSHFICMTHKISTTMIILIAVYGEWSPSKSNCEDLGGFFLAKVGGSKMTGTLGVKWVWNFREQKAGKFVLKVALEKFEKQSR